MYVRIHVRLDRLQLYVYVVGECNCACSTNRDRDFCFHREFTALIRSLLLPIQCSTDEPAAFEVNQVLTVRDAVLKPVDNERYRVSFGHNVRFDVSAQQPFFYREVQQFLQGLCVTLATEYQQDQGNRLCLICLLIQY